MEVSGGVFLIAGGIFVAVVVAILIWVAMTSNRGG